MTNPVDIDALRALTPEDAPVPEFTTPDHKASARPWSMRGDKDKPSGRKPREPKGVPSYRKGQYIETLETMYAGIGAILAPFDEHCAQPFIEQAHACAESLDAAAEKSVPLRRFLDMITTGGTWGAVFVAHAPILVAVASHHTPFMAMAQEKMGERMMKNAMANASQNGYKP